MRFSNKRKRSFSVFFIFDDVSTALIAVYLQVLIHYILYILLIIEKFYIYSFTKNVTIKIVLNLLEFYMNSLLLGTGIFKQQMVF